jgi:hypothetical protein
MFKTDAMIIINPNLGFDSQLLIETKRSVIKKKFDIPISGNICHVRKRIRPAEKITNKYEYRSLPAILFAYCTPIIQK